MMIELTIRNAEHLMDVIVEVHRTHADDLCWMPADVNKIFVAAGLPPQNLQVGDVAAMRRNCDRYTACLAEGGPWKSYQELEAEIVRLHNLRVKSDHEIEQCLGKALGYPWFKDDQASFPGATESYGVCVGEHIPITLASETAHKINLLKSSLAGRDKALVLLSKGFESACENLDRLKQEVRALLLENDKLKHGGT